jgi:hypothetical protein
MKIRPLVFIFIVLIAAMVMSRQGVGQSAVAGTQNAPAAQNAPVAPQNVSAMRFLAPQPGEKLQQSAVTVRYAIDQPQIVAASTPTFKVRLDGREPVETTEKESTFTGLAPGNHTLAVEVVDANGTPVQGTHTEIQFTVTPEPAPVDPAAAKPPAVTAPAENGPTNRQRRKKPQPQTEPPQASLSQPELISASLKIVPRTSFSGQSGNGPSGAPENGRLAQDGNLPEAASALPLLSIIGAGMLIGGLLSARKTRSMKT